MSLTPAQQRERAIVLLQQAFGYPMGPALVRALQTRFEAGKFNEVPDELCGDLLMQAETLLASLNNQPEPEPSPVFNPTTALAHFVLVADQVKSRVSGDPAHERLDWAVQRVLVNPERLEGCDWGEVELQLEKVAADEDLFAEYTPEELLDSERRLARILDFENATHADFWNMLEEDRDLGMLVEEFMSLLYGDDDHPRLKRLLRALAGAPFGFRMAIAAICDPRPHQLSCEDVADIRATMLRRAVPDANDDDDACEIGAGLRH